MYLEVTDSEAIANHEMYSLTFGPILAECSRTIENKSLLLSSRRPQFGVPEVPGISSTRRFGCGDGIVLAPDAQISVTPGKIVGEIISGGNINIASGGGVQGIASVPDTGSCMFLLSIGIGCLNQAKKRFLS